MSPTVLTLLGFVASHIASVSSLMSRKYKSATQQAITKETKARYKKIKITNIK